MRLVVSVRTLQVYIYSKCSTCRKAVSWLKENNFDYELIDIINNPPDKDLLAIAFEQFSNRKLLFNTSGKSYRALGSKIVNEMSNDEAIEALSNDGGLIKRPFVLTNSGKIVVGFKPENWGKEYLK